MIRACLEFNPWTNYKVFPCPVRNIHISTKIIVLFKTILKRNRKFFIKKKKLHKIIFFYLYINWALTKSLRDDFLFPIHQRAHLNNLPQKCKKNYFEFKKNALEAQFAVKLCEFGFEAAHLALLSFQKMFGQRKVWIGQTIYSFSDSSFQIWMS